MLRLIVNSAGVAVFAFTAYATMCSSTALALGDLENEGIIRQTVDIKGNAEFTQRNSVASVQGANLVGSADRLVNKGLIEQNFKAERVTLDQNMTAGSTQFLNGVLAGNPSAPNVGQ